MKSAIVAAGVTVMAVLVACCAVDATDAPRTLVYQFSVRYRGQLDSTNGHVTAVIREKDGVRAVDVTELVDHSARPEQAFDCTLKAGVSDVECSDKMAGTDESLTMVQFLNPAFYDLSNLDANGRWKTEARFWDETIKGNFAVTRRSGDLLTIGVRDEERDTKEAFLQGWETGTLTYDAEARVRGSMIFETTSLFGTAEGEARLGLICSPTRWPKQAARTRIDDPPTSLLYCRSSGPPAGAADFCVCC